MIKTFIAIVCFISIEKYDEIEEYEIETPMIRHMNEEEVNYTITSKFGTRYDPFNKEETKFHSGIDIAAPKNTKILASADGIVHETGYNSSLGNYVYIKHNFDNVILYESSVTDKFKPRNETEVSLLKSNSLVF